MISCVVDHMNYRVVRIRQIERRPMAKTEVRRMHAVFEQIKHILRNVFDLKRVRVGFSSDLTEPLNQFLVKVMKMIGENPKRGIFLCMFDDRKILFAGMIEVQ